jgi:hypothetical protein
MANAQPNQPPDEEQPEDERAHDERGAIEPLEPESRRARGPVYRRIYTTGNAELDRQINEVVGALTYAQPGEANHHDPADLELVREMLTSSVRLVVQKATRAELKLVNAAVKEFAYAFRTFAPYRGMSKVSIFGSARVKPGEPEYVAARDFAHQIAGRGWMVITGAGPGIMEAGIEGAGAANSFGVGIRLPFEAVTTQFHADDPKLINFRYFFTRKVTFVKEAHAFVLLPGGYGTLDEAFELLTLVQTGKAPPAPIVLLDVPGGTYWLSWTQFVEQELRARGYISPEDEHLVKITDDVSVALAEITGFYRNYHSLRFVGGDLVLRLHHEPTPELLHELNDVFGDILTSGKIEAVGASRAELADRDVPELARIAMRFNRSSYSRLRLLIDRLNAEVDQSASVVDSA